MTDSAESLDAKAIEELERLEQAATPGPWHKEMMCLGPNGSGPMTLGVGSKESPVCIVHGIVESPRGQRDAAFIATIRNALPELLRLARLGMRAEAGWIPCGERMPPGEDGTDTSRTRAVLFVVDVGESGRVLSLGYWDSRERKWIDSEGGGWDSVDVAYWRELPGLPAEREGA